MLVPISPFIMDFLIVGNLVFALIIFITALTVRDILKLSSLPSMLLLATFSRLAINLASTRNILSSGEAGKVIEFFGSVVIAENIALGIVMFLMITLVQLLVIAKGGERVAEVAARFSLDAMPGRQMSIDSDMRSGLLEVSEGVRKRQELQSESRFYGALDGAMKFIKGDAIAGIIIIAVNISGGILIGITREGGQLSEILTHYTILTIGDGLAAQIPALMNSVCAGIVVTKVSSAEQRSLSDDLVSQILQNKILVGVVIFSLVLLPIISALPFFPCFLSAGFLSIWLFLLRFADRRNISEKREGDIYLIPKLVRVTICLPKILNELTENAQDRKDKLKKSAQSFLVSNLDREIIGKIYKKYGVPIDTLNIELAKGESCFLDIHIRGHSAFLLKWQDNTVPTSFEEVEREIRVQIEKLLFEIIDDRHTRLMLDLVENNCSEMVSNVIPTLISLSGLTQILRKLLAEEISCLNLDLILQSISETSSKDSDLSPIIEEVRIALRRQITGGIIQNGSVECFILDPVVDALISRDAKGRDGLDIDLMEQVAQAVKELEPKPIITGRHSRRRVREYLLARGICRSVYALEEVIAPLKILGIICERGPAQLGSKELKEPLGELDYGHC